MSSDVDPDCRPGADEDSGQAPPIAVFSDIHANVTALRAVLADAASRGIRHMVCLGDIVGYGPDPVECWRLVSRLCGVIVCGNHEQGLGGEDLERFHPRAAEALAWTRRRILLEPDGEHIIETILALPRSVREGECLFVHGSPAEPTTGYLLPGDAFDKQRMDLEFRQVPLYAFNGHTHIPGVIARGMRFLPPEALQGSRYALLGRPTIINVGSVGQPRDGNPKASYVTVEHGTVYFHRVDYDAESVCRRILATAALDPFLGQRLIVGF